MASPNKYCFSLQAFNINLVRVTTEYVLTEIYAKMLLLMFSFVCYPFVLFKTF